MKIKWTTLVAVLILVSCGIHRPQKPVEAPPVEAPAVAKVHNCDMCHLPHQKGTGGMVLLNKPVNELCVSCHKERAGSGEHKVNIKAAMPVEDLPLDAEGKITCLTCHDPHGSKGYRKLLRAPDFNKLCEKCHKNY